MNKGPSVKAAHQGRLADPSPTKTTALSTKALLVEAGERLFGERGFDGATLREITIAAGQSNSNVVQYHFGDKAGLIGAILADRVARIEHVRSMQLAVLDDRRQPDPKQVLKVLWIPLMSIKDGNGGHPFCRFMLQYMLHPRLTRHPLASVYMFPFGPDQGEVDMPSIKEAAQLLFSAYAGLPKDLVLKRLSALVTMFLATVVEYDNAQRLQEGRAVDPYDIDPILDMAVAALGAPA
jgi:AcrR family transcriptional regulator